MLLRTFCLVLLSASTISSTWLMSRCTSGFDLEGVDDLLCLWLCSILFRGIVERGGLREGSPALTVSRLIVYLSIDWRINLSSSFIPCLTWQTLSMLLSKSFANLSSMRLTYSLISLVGNSTMLSQSSIMSSAAFVRGL